MYGTDFVTIFNVILVKNWRISGLEWNERTQYLASCSLDGWIKVILLIPYISLFMRRDKQMTEFVHSLSFITLSFRLTDLVDGQR